jgi:predicted ArsR family transcriptional regulator
VTDAAAERLHRHRALSDPSRARILAELADRGPLDVREVAERVGLHVNTVRVHLNALARAGLVSSETRPPQGRGRPRLAYDATAAAGEEGSRRYRLLAEILTALLAGFGPGAGQQLEETGEAWGQYLVDSAPPFASLSGEEAMRRLVGLLDEIGFQPRLEQEARGRRILMRPCPFLELARVHQDVICPIHLGLIRGALAELGATTRVTKLQPFVRPDLCVAHLAVLARAERPSARERLSG